MRETIQSCTESVTSIVNSEFIQQNDRISEWIFCNIAIVEIDSTFVLSFTYLADGKAQQVTD